MTASDSQQEPDRRPRASATLTERRGNPRRRTMTVFTMRVGEDSVLGAGRDVSVGGASFITSDSVRVEVCYELDGKETHVPARLVRMETISAGTYSMAVEFERPLSEDQLPAS